MKPAEWAELPTRAQVLSMQRAIPPWSSIRFRCVAAVDGELKDCVTIRSDFKASAASGENEAKVRALLPFFRLVQIDAAGEQTKAFVIDLLVSPHPNGDLLPIPVITEPHWMRTPTADELMRAYPKAALRAGVEGHATMKCRVGDDDRPTNCVIIEETPPGVGFGQATLSLAPDFKADPMMKGGQVVVPLRWKIAR